MYGRRTALVVMLGLLVGPVLTTPPSAVASTQTHNAVVSANPANWTPNVLDGSVKAIVQVGNTMIVGGAFTQVQGSVDTDPVLPRSNIFAFDATTGVISSSFAPTVDGEVSALAVSADGQSVYAGGLFNNVNGTSTRKLARLSVASGAKVNGFRPGGVSAKINDLALSNGRLIVAGTFQTINSISRPIIASLDPLTGALTDAVNVSFTGKHNGGVTSIVKFAVNPAGTRLVAIGNFTTVGGLARRQVAMLDISGATATVSSWLTTFYTSTCAGAFDTYLRDLDISPDGSYVVISTTGAYRGAESACDVIARFEMGSTDADVRPTWRDYTGGDTTYAVAITGSVVYVGGHFRWVNNAFAADRAGAGAVPREGIAALDPANGLPLSWNPGRTRGVGVFDMLATPNGLWVGSDTDRIANELRQRISFLPLQGGAVSPANLTGTLPNDVLLLGRTTGAGAALNDLRRQSYTGTGSPGATVTSPGTETWGTARGAVLIDSTVYTGWSDGRFLARSFNGTEFGTPTSVDLFAGTFAADLPNVTGMAFSQGRLYFTLLNDTRLFYRYFTPESGVVGAVRFEATGNVAAMAPQRVAGMFLSGTTLYLADRTDGRLYRVGLSGGVVTSAPVLADATIDWRSRGALVDNELPPTAPTAAFTAGCINLACSVDGTASSDADGTVQSWAWDFGDGTTQTTSTPTASHTYAGAGTNTISLVVTDDQGLVSTSSTQQVSVSPPPVSAIAFRGSAVATANLATHRVSVPAAVQAGDAMLMFATTNSLAAVTSPPAGWASAGTQQSGSDTRTLLYTKVAVAGDAGAAQSITFATATKADLTLLAYSGTSATPFAAVASAGETVNRSTHTTPATNVATTGSWVVSYWADKSSATTSWSSPAGQTQRSQSAGAGAGRVTSLSTDYAAASPAGSTPGLTATAGSAAAKATMWTVVIGAA